MKVLVVDDEENVRKGIATFLELHGHQALAVGDLASAKAAWTAESSAPLAAATGAAPMTEPSEPFQAALVDVYVGSENGAELLDFAAERRLAAPVIMMSGKGSVKDAVAAVRNGAYDFLEKPLDTDRLLAILRNLERETAALRRLEAYRAAWLEEHVYLGGSSALAAAFEAARRAAASPLSILVTGPTGSGKELIARWAHLCSPRSQGPFVAVNCAAVPPELAESAFFGSRKGAYTGAHADRRGYFEAAAGGSLFLDEVGELSLALQASLLRAVETGEIQPVGADKATSSDARILAATNRDLAAEARSGRFREDLYWRLAQVTVSLPPLTERREDIRGLAEFLGSPIRAQMGSGAPELEEGALAYLESRPWPGNVREMRAFLERALWLAPRGARIDAAYLAGLEARREEGDRRGAGRGAAAAGAAGAGAATGEDRTFNITFRKGGQTSLASAKEEFERAYVDRALQAAGGSVAQAAEALGLLPNNLSRKLRELGLR
jgi:DNA-binding NtrC family response regulator